MMTASTTNATAQNRAGALAADVLASSEHVQANGSAATSQYRALAPAASLPKWAAPSL